MVELSVQLQTFSKDRQYDASMTLSMDSFRIRILRVSDQSLVADYAHPQSTACNSIKFFNDILSICLSNGSVLLYSVAQAAVLHTLTGLSEPCVDFCLHSNVAYALGSNGSLVEYSYPSWSKMRTTSTKKIAFKLAVSPDGKKLAIGGNQIDLIKADSFKSAGILPGHASQITNLVFLDKLLFSCAQDDRFVCCWNVKKKEIYSNFTADSPPVSIDVGGVLLAHLENGSAALWAINESTESRRPNVTVELNASDSESGLLYSALKDDEKIIVAYGNIFKPTFELVKFKNQGEFIPQVILTRTVTAGKEVVSKRLNTVHESSAIQQVPVMPQELTIEDMVKQITVGQGKKTKSSTQISLLQLLSQAIHAGDVELYEKAFAVNDKKIINATVKKLSPTQVLPLIDQLIPEISSRLGTLYRALSTRQETLTKLYRLSGRLDMIEIQTEPSENQEDEDVVVYESASEEEEVMSQASSEMDEPME